jgi:solute carrier family 25 phosphate transporter 3
LAFKGMTPEQQEALSESTKLAITLGSGITAGFAAAILSHVSTALLPPVLR